MTTLAFWFFGVWVSALVGFSLAIIGFDTWLNYRREALRKLIGGLK